MKNKEVSFGEYIQKQRIKLGHSVREMAAEVGISPAYLSAIENEQRVPSHKIIPALAKSLKMKEDDIAARANICRLNGIQSKTTTDMSGLVRFYQTKVSSEAEVR